MLEAEILWNKLVNSYMYCFIGVVFRDHCKCTSSNIFAKNYFESNIFYDKKEKRKLEMCQAFYFWWSISDFLKLSRLQTEFLDFHRHSNVISKSLKFYPSLKTIESYLNIKSPFFGNKFNHYFATNHLDTVNFISLLLKIKNPFTFGTENTPIKCYQAYNVGSPIYYLNF